MSLILDALKRSEAERSARVLAPAAARYQARPRWTRLVGIGLALAALGMAAIWWRTGTDAVPQATPTKGAETTLGQAAEPLKPPPANILKDTPSRPDPVPPTTAAAPETPAPEPPATRLASRPPGESDTDEQASSARDLRAEAQASTDQATSGGSGPPEPPRELRQRARALRMQMHFYSAEPEARFVVIDGQRLQSGDEIAGFKIVQIRRDGVLLSDAGHQVLLRR